MTRVEFEQKIGVPKTHAVEIFNMKNTVNVVNSLSTKAKVFTNLSNIETSFKYSNFRYMPLGE